MRRKQLFAVLMAGSMAASLAACGKTDTKKTTAATEKKTEAATEKKTEVATTEAKTEKATEKETEAATEKETEAATEAKTEEASSEEATEVKTEEASSEEASSEEASSEDVSAQAETEEESSEVATEAKTEEASSEEASSEEATESETEEASSEEASSEEASSEEATEAKTEEASSEEASSEEATEAESEEASSEEETEAETEEDIDGTGFKIGMVTDVGGVNDGSFNQSAWEGLQRAGEAFGCEVKYIESKGDADYVPNIESFLDEDYDLIVCVGYMMADAVRDAAELYPDQKFAIIDDASNADLDNVTCMMFEQEQASYLVGLAAGYTTESNIVGFVTGAANETMNSFGYGYCAGVDRKSVV